MKSKKIVTFAKKDLVLMMTTIRNIKKRDHCHYTGKFREAAHSICILRYKTLKEIPVVFHNGFTYDCLFIIRQLAKEFDGRFECLGENTEKYIIFLVPMGRELHNGKPVTYKLKFIDSFRFLSTSYQNWLIIYLKFTKKNAKDENEYVILLDLKIINYITNATNVKKDN